MINLQVRFFTGLALGLLFSAGLSARAATLTVSNLNDSGSGSLRQAITNASANDIITFSSALTGTNTLTGGELGIGKNLTIVGPGPTVLTIDANNNSRIFNISNGSTVNISGLCIQKGRAAGANGVITTNYFDPNREGALGQGGGFLNQGTLTLSNCTIQYCSAAGGNGGHDGSALGAGGPGRGGAIANLGTLLALNCTFASNNASGGDGASVLSPGDSRAVLGGFGGDALGAAAYNYTNAVSAVFLNCVFHGNKTTAGDGGNGTTAAANHGVPGGTGIGGAIASATILLMTNCTLYGNSVVGGRGGDAGGSGGAGGDALGGGIGSGTSLQLTACTIATNSALGGDDGYGAFGAPDGVSGGAYGGNIAAGIYLYDTAKVYNSIIVGGTVTAGAVGSRGASGSTIGPDFYAAPWYGPVASQGFNIIGNTNGASGFGVAGDLIGADPKLAALKNNGGTTYTMALRSGSLAINTGDDSLTNTLATDQRGAARKTGLHVDIGAYESGTLFVLNTDDAGSGSLRQAILDALTNDTIIFSTSATGSVVLTSGELFLNRSVNIAGPSWGVAVDGNFNGRVFDIASGVTANIMNLGIFHGRANGGTAGENQNGADVYGGGVLNQGTLTLANCTFWANGVTGGNGGNANLSGNKNGGNGASGNGGGVANLATLNLINCTLAANFADGGTGGNATGSGINGNGGSGRGGGLFNQGTLTIQSCTFNGNLSSGGTAGHTGSTAGNGGPATGGGYFQSSGTTGIGNTIIANDSVNGGLGLANGAATGPDVSGTVTSWGYNLIGKTNGSSVWNASDLTGTIAAPLNPLLGGLQANGGPTFTMALLTGSPAIDAGYNAGLSTDQRGLPRTVDFPAIANGASSDGTDIGAYEVQPSILDIGLRVFDGVLIKKIAGEYPAISPLRISKNGTNYGIGLTATNSADASKFRVQTSSGIKAWQTIP